MTDRSISQRARPGQLLRQFEVLLGKWAMVGKHPAFPASVRGSSSFEWLLDRALLVWHFDWESPGPPSAVSVVGGDDSGESCELLYADERGVSRIYQTSIDGGVWQMWRESPGFSQRMVGTIADDANSIVVRGELSRDGTNWEQDLNVTYTRRVAGRRKPSSSRKAAE
jgi:hypothetical protein